MFFLSPKINCFFLEIGNNPMSESQQNSPYVV